MMHASGAIGLALCAVFLAAPGRAADQPLHDPAAADVLFRDGRRLMEAQDYERACPKFAESQRLEFAVGTLMNLAACQEKLGRLASAWHGWKEAVGVLPAGDDRVSFAASRVAALEKRLPKLVVTLKDGPGEAVVRCDDVVLPAASLGVALPVDPGAHVVTVDLRGHAVGQFTITVAEAELATIRVSPGPLVVSEHARVAGGAAPAIGWVALGVGILGVGTATVTGLMLVSIKNTVQSDCPDKRCQTQDGLDAVDRGRTLLVVNTTSWLVGAAGLGLGAALVLPFGVSSSPGVANMSLRGAF